jgi:hypothetical protein
MDPDFIDYTPNTVKVQGRHVVFSCFFDDDKTRKRLQDANKKVDSIFETCGRQ